MVDQVDSLEDWVAIKDHPFLDTKLQQSKTEFFVGWNKIEAQLAITCKEKRRSFADTEPQGWSGLFSFSELNSIHEQLALVHPSLGQYFPNLPYEPRGVWAYVLAVEEPGNNICEEIQRYLTTAIDICGQSLLVSTLFEEHTLDEYFEKISELKRRYYDEAVANAEDELKNVLFLREGSINMLDMQEVYGQEDVALFKWNVALSELYNYLIQPFLDMREVAINKSREAKSGLQDPNLGERRKQEYAAMFSEWHENYIHAIDRIQELYMEYYENTVKTLTGARERMFHDQKQFGKKSFEVVGMERLHRCAEDLSLENLQLLNNTKKYCENQRDKTKEEIACLAQSPATNIDQELRNLENAVYKWQLSIYDTQMEVLQEEERLHKTQMAAIRHQLAATEDDSEFYDTVETEEDLDRLDEDVGDKESNERLAALRHKLSLVYKKRAQLRNKKKGLLKKKKVPTATLR